MSSLGTKCKNIVKKLVGKGVDDGSKNLFTQDEIIDVKEELRRRHEVKIQCDIENTEALPLTSARKDKEIEQILEETRPDFENMVIVKDPYGMAPLCAYALFVTEKPCKSYFVVKGHKETVDIAGEVSTLQTRHRLPIFGLYPAETNQVTISIIDESDNLLDTKVIEIETEKLPKNLVNEVKVMKHTTTSAYKMTLISGKAMPYPIGFDEEGNIRYFMKFRPKGYGLLPMSGGHYIFVERKMLIPTYQLPYSNQVYDIDLLGRVHQVFYVAKGCHHDVCEMTPGGNLLMISNSLKGHIGDVILEFDRQTGEIVKRLDFRELFGDVYRDQIGWTHINTLNYDAKTETVLACARNLHTAIKIDWKTNEILWMLGDPDFWAGTGFEDKVLQPMGEVKWSYQAHAPYMVDADLDGNPDTCHMIIFDNHWEKRRPAPNFDNDDKSYVKIYNINEKEHTVSMGKSFGGVKNKITSNARMEYERGRVFSMGAYLEPQIDGCNGMIYEFDYNTEEVLNQYLIKHTYYRGYELSPEYNELSKPFDLKKDYIIGYLQKPIEQKKKIEMPTQKVSDIEFGEKEEIHYMRVEETIQFESKDHLIDGVYFVGEKYEYYRDFSKPKQTDKRFVNIIFYIAVPTHMMKPDTYKIVLKFKGKLYDTEKKITIN